MRFTCEMLHTKGLTETAFSLLQDSVASKVVKKCYKSHDEVLQCLVLLFDNPKIFRLMLETRKYPHLTSWNLRMLTFFSLNIKKQVVNCCSSTKQFSTNFFCLPGRREKQVCTCGVGGSVFVSVWVYLCVFVTCEEEKESLPFKKKKRKKLK